MRVPSTKSLMGILAVMTSLVMLSEAKAYKNGVITMHGREVTMTEPDVVQFENRLMFSPGKSNKHG